MAKSRVEAGTRAETRDTARQQQSSRNVGEDYLVRQHQGTSPGPDR